MGGANAPTGRLGLLMRRVHLFRYDTTQADGVSSRWVSTFPATAGRLLTLHSILDSRHDVGAGARVRFDVYEQDHLLVTGLDDQVVSLLGTNAAPPSGFPAVQRQTHYLEVCAGRHSHRGGRAVHPRASGRLREHRPDPRRAAGRH
jgi:hypothetical protein